MNADRPTDARLRRSHLTFPVVGIGASAGGHAPLLAFFSAMPADSGMAFVVLMHLSPEHTSELPQLLQSCTAMPVEAPAGTVPIEANRVYVITPDKLLSMDDGELCVRLRDSPRGRPVAIDLFFRTLAIVHRERAIAILLSGTGSDGTAGIARVKGEGGLTLAQDPDEAEFDSMPRNAIASRQIDFVLPVADMPARLLHLWHNARSIALPPLVSPPVPPLMPPLPATPSVHPSEQPPVPPSAPLPLNMPTPDVDGSRSGEEALRRILDTLHRRSGHDFNHYKRATVLRRLERRLQVHGLPNLDTYLALLLDRPDESSALLGEMLIGVTNFFRDPEAFDVLRSVVLTELFGESPGAGVNHVRVWVAGCSTGEEAYSIAMLLQECAAETTHAPRISVFATDIDEEAIATARAGVYPASIESDVSAERLARFFDRENDQYRIKKELRETVMFATHNLLRDPPFSRLDLVCCRNLLIYLDRAVHAEVLETFHFALRPGGRLFLGISESAETPDSRFTAIDKKHRVFRANVGIRSERPIPAHSLVSLISMTSPVSPLSFGLTALTQRDSAEASGPRALSYADLHRRAAEQYAPASLLIDREAQIVHVSEHAGRYLRHAGGPPTNHLLSLVRPELRLELRTAIFQALRIGKSVEARRVRMDDGDASHYINMIVQPVDATSSAGAPLPLPLPLPLPVPVSLLLVLFVEVDDSMAHDLASDERDDRGTVENRLEEELRHTRVQLQSTVEHAETSVEELKASNEELQAINEELRSTSEELETSKEELQSINEELITVNLELKSKVDETAKINDDLQNLIASTDIATVFVDRRMVIKRYTPRATRLFNLIPGDVGRSLLDITHRLDYPALADDAAESFRSLRVIERELVSEDGAWYLVRVLPYRTTEDRIDGAVLTFVDITSRHRAEAGLKLVAESTRDYAMISFGLEGRIETWNQGAERLFGYSESEAIGLSSAVLFTPEDRARGVPDEEMRAARDTGRAEDDRWHLRKDGTRVFCTGITTPLYRDGVPRGFGKIARDVTGDKRFGEAREVLLQRESAARVEAQAASHLKDEFLAVLSHELKNPLNLIQISAELMMRLPEARALPAVLHAGQTIVRTVASQAQIIDDLLDLSRVNTGKLALRRSAVDLAAIAASIASALADDASAKQVDLRIELPDHPVMVDADPVRVEQIVWNLVSNAVKFTPAGGHVVVRALTDESFGRFEVEDDGQGIAPEFIGQVFGMFQQAEAAAVRRHGGMGIGLALVKHLTDLHAGRVEATSAGLGLGARFRVWLPLDKAPLAAGGRLDGPSAHHLAGRRALLVDDDIASLRGLAQVLQFEQLSTVTAGSAAEALALIDAGERFDVIVSDIGMPGTDGYALLQQLRARPATASTPVVAVTGFGRSADVQRAKAAGFAGHLGKPVSIDALLRLIASLL